MRKKVYIIWVLIFTALPFTIMAQDEQNVNLSAEMSAFNDYCVRAANAAASCNIDELSACIEKWEPGEYDDNDYEPPAESFEYNGVEIEYAAFGNLQCVDTTAEEIVGMHFGFVPRAVDSWIANHCEAVEIADANMLRGGSVHLEYSVRAIAANAKATYSTRGSGDIEMFVVAENGGKVGLSVHAVEKDRSGNVTNETSLSDNQDCQSAQLAWTMNRNGSIEFTVENLSEKPISYIIVKKM